MTVSDDQTSPEARAAVAQAAAVAPVFPVSPGDCDHDAPVVVGQQFDDDEHTLTVSRCPDCGTEFVTEADA